MSLLVDRELHALTDPARVPAPIATAVPRGTGHWDSRIQPASLDLTIGRILLPPEDMSSNEVRVESNIDLGEGKTAIIETLEELHLPPDLAAIGFPPSSVSLEGLLMTNPGHIDPGYIGKLKFTVINMGRQSYKLVSGNPICTVLFFRISAPDCDYDHLDKAGLIPSRPPATDPDRNLRHILRQLSPDFLNFNNRIRNETARQSLASQIRVPIISGILAVFVTLMLNYLSGINDLKVKIEGIEKSAGMQEIKSRVDKLENQQPISTQLSDLKARIEKLEAQSNQNPK